MLQTVDWSDAATALTDALHLATPPVAITFCASIPAGVAPFDARRPEPTADGRTGAVSAGCVFWTKATERTFSTVGPDHRNCSVGTLTHGLASLAEVAGGSDVAALVDSGWVTMDAVPSIPVVVRRPAAIVYGPLRDTPCEPDVVLIRINARQLMVLFDALPGLRIDGKPQCHIVAVAKELGEVAVSVGCALSRARTNMRSADMSCAIPAARLAEVLERIESTVATNAIVASYAVEDARRFVAVD